MKLFFSAAALIGLGTLMYFYIMFQGPRMQVQPSIRAYQRAMPLPPQGMVPLEGDTHAVPRPGEAEDMKNPLQPGQAGLDRGKTYYDYYCVFCHGRNGQGDGPVGYSYMPAPADLHSPRIAAMSDGELLRAMLLGTGHEPVLARVVPPGHRWFLVGYVRALGRTPRAPAENQGSHVLERGPETR